MNELNGKTVKRPDEVVFGPEERGYVYAIARRYVPEQEAEDVAQEAMLLAYRHRDAFRGEARYRTWLYRIASTTALGYLRRKRRSREQLAVDATMHDPVSEALSPEQTVASQEETVRVDRAIDQLAPKFRAVVELRAAEHSETEIARELGISVANVKIRMHRARAALRGELQDLRAA